MDEYCNELDKWGFWDLDFINPNLGLWFERFMMDYPKEDINKRKKIVHGAWTDSSTNIFLSPIYIETGDEEE